MKNITHPNRGKMLVHGKGLGEVTAKKIEDRAVEIATTEGRAAPTPNDRDRAWAELTGITLPAVGPDDVASEDSLTRDPSDPPAHHGRQTPNFDGLDEEKATERLVTEGVEEAQHDQMLAARAKRPL